MNCEGTESAQKEEEEIKFNKKKDDGSDLCELWIKKIVWKKSIREKFSSTG